MRGDPLDRLRLDARGDRAVQPAGLDELGDDDPPRRPLGEHRPGREDEPRVAGAEVLARVSPSRSPMCDSRPASSAAWTRAASAGSSLLDDAEVAGDAAQLAGEVLPLADAQVVQELLAAHPAKRVAGPLLSLLAQVAPQVQVEMKSECSSANRACFCRAASSLVGGPLTRVGDRQRRREHQHLAHAALGVGLQDHPAEPRVDGQPREPAAERAVIAPSRVEGAELLQQQHAVADAAPVGRIEEREVSMSPSCSAAICRITAARLVRRISGSVNRGRDVEVLLGVQPDAHAGRDAPERPARCAAEACEIGSIGSRCTFVRRLYREMRAVPGSTT